jgi:hypothetical protein
MPRERDGLLVLHGDPGNELSLELPGEDAQGLLRRLCAEGGAPASRRWELTRTLDARPLLAAWREAGWWAHAVPRTALLREDGRRRLVLHLETSGDRAALTAAAPLLLRLLRSRGRITEVAVEAVTPAPEVPRRGRQPRVDVFGWAGPASAAEAGEEDVGRLLPEDLPWLLPGERLDSSRHGRLRLKRVLDEGRRFLLRDEAGAFHTLAAAELLRTCRRG